MKERLRQRRKNQKYGRPFSFLYLNDGEGVVWKREEGGEDIGDDEEIVDILEFFEKPIGDEPRYVFSLPTNKAYASCDGYSGSFSRPSLSCSWISA
ncbi:MAG: hypothetical protein VCE75_11725 [Alphaproteobacteria bacterium]